MSVGSPLVRGPVQVTWKADGSVDTITYLGEPLARAVSDRFQIQVGTQGAELSSGLGQLINDLFDALASLPPTEKRLKVFLADKVFQHLVVRMSPPNPKVHGIIWRAILDYVWKWEDSHEKVHKGTPYYFMAESFLESGDVPSAYICFFNAIEEDKRNLPHIPMNPKDRPAYCTTSLSCNPNNALFLSVVMPLRSRLQTFIDGYNTRLSRNLTLLTVDSRFLQADDLEDIKRFFVATFHEVYHLAPMNATRMINNDYSKLKIIDTLFNLGLVVDQLLEHRFLGGASRKDKTMANAIYQLALSQSWTNSTKSPTVPQFLEQVRPDLNRDDPAQVIPPLLDGSATFDGNKINEGMQATFLAYHLRNFAGHHVEGRDILVQRYSEILDAVMGAILVAVETL
jgi:hypothetical protein